ncbi:hypothetical protein PHYBLDRAFT_166122 [Phycomyces blakesleeanus NRRL 1555(-)]|uniref:Uncharacterized protein n=1 Tax=Phycomyces blakesleeanus (strain ATCC 8743b / DSM 1359 / FGSC 10004 / NBRC 33097 / NRRL 1555) TaxID=763407 RepID=A0A167NKM6_PHYB8|nr:hypothetical protein PHYBLDRAFT_166122 [Phycomyces blakesleeanus NRRL 1555(-)]OAD76149.1 hypothetical protein PHYBLDRAFT_166122 [Phycomyces blakesleeanus NRRL 1555(-)]|eukprot:XP_018294189.1 hypothetical protein PHYBLDRAFT_166122 [Phycomyces blakesleeanus NRRL 1555(-)]
MEDEIEELKSYYFQYKNSISIEFLFLFTHYATITVINLKTQYRSISGTLSDPRKFQLLLEFSCIQYLAYANRQQPERASKSVVASSHLLSNQNFLRDESGMVVAALDLFDDLEAQDVNERLGNIQHVLEGFVHLSTRCELVRCIARNDPLNFTEAIDHLLQSAHCLSTRYSIQLSEMIYTMVEEKPRYAATVRFKLVEMQLLPDLVTRLTVYCEDEHLVSDALVVYRAVSKQQTSFCNHQKPGVRQDSKIIKGDVQVNQVELAMAIRVVAGLVGFFGLQLSEAEVDMCFYLLRVTEMERLVKLLLSLILISSVAILKRQRDLVAVLTQLLQSGVSEMPMLLMVYFKTDQISQVEDMIRSILEMQVPIPKLGLFEMQKLCGHIYNTAFSAIAHA